MKKKISLVGAKAREKITDGVDLLSNAVKITLGPKGKNFASGIHGGAIQISNDGVSLAKEIQGRDEFEDMGVRAVREAATKTNDKVGDGTTTAVVLTQAILKKMGFDREDMGATSCSPEIVKQIEAETSEVVKALTEMAIPVTTREQLISVAKVSVEDQGLAEMIGGAQWDVTGSGTVMAEEHNEPVTKVEFIHGVRIDNGYGSSVLVNNLEKQALELKNIPIIVTTKIFNTADSVARMQPLFQAIIERSKNSETPVTVGVILVARAFDETAIGLCFKNIQKFHAGEGGFPIYPINAPYTDQEEVMQDLAAATGARYVSSTEKTEHIMLHDVGIAGKIFCQRYSGIITGEKRGEDDTIDQRVDKRANDIREKLKGEISPFEKRLLESRLAQLTAGTAMIKVGAETEQERKYKKDKVDDAINAVKAAMQEGVVPGGGLALKSIADAMPNARISDALREPYRQIMANAGGTFDIPEWVQDPLKVVRTAFEKASSIARSLATTEILVTYEEEKPMWVQQAKVNMAEQE